MHFTGKDTVSLFIILLLTSLCLFFFCSFIGDYHNLHSRFKLQFKVSSGGATTLWIFHYHCLYHHLAQVDGDIALKSYKQELQPCHHKRQKEEQD